jgi:drug/metabolite transporter (DMT)-like permease
LKKEAILVANLSKKQAEILLLCVIVSRSVSFMFSKLELARMGAFNLLSLRFVCAFILLCVLFWRRLGTIRRRTVGYGALIGLIYILVLAAEMTGLKTIATSEASFLENTAVVFVPLANAWLLHRRPDKIVLISAFTAIIGVGFLTLGQGIGSLSGGTLFCILAAFLYTLAILVTDRLSRREDPLLMGIVQVGFMGFYATIATFLFETPHLPNTPMDWGFILALAVVCTGFGYTLQPVAQSKVSAERAGLFCAASPVCATVLGAIFLHEQFGLSGLVGIMLVLGSILLPKLIHQRQTPLIRQDERAG